jgi:hypothetical protein
MTKMVIAESKLRKEDSEGKKEPTVMDKFKVHIQCIDPLNKALQSMKDCLDDLQDDGLKEMLVKSIESVGLIEEQLLAKAGEALKEQIIAIRGGSNDQKGIQDLANQIAGKTDLISPASDTNIPSAGAIPNEPTQQD